MPVCMWRSENTVQESVLCFYHVNPRDELRSSSRTVKCLGSLGSPTLNSGPLVIKTTLALQLRQLSSMKILILVSIPLFYHWILKKLFF